MGLRGPEEGGVDWSSYLRLVAVVSDEYCDSSAIAECSCVSVRRKEGDKRNPNEIRCLRDFCNDAARVGLRLFCIYRH